MTIKDQIKELENKEIGIEEELDRLRLIRQKE